MAHLVRATAVLAVVWSALAIGDVVDPSLMAWTGRLVMVVGGIHA
jgi:hypothetical protein